MKSIIIGAGTYGEVYLAYLQEYGMEVVGFLDDDSKFENQIADNLPVLGIISKLETHKDTYGIEAMYCPFGDNKLWVRCLSQSRQLGDETQKQLKISLLQNYQAERSCYAA